ncbi:hypothetical protein VPH35_055400 [Triticum aestivum]|uniref:Uncharacterized protein n=1 Tax=Triticum aestivum TaxID=4565 RepID=A0A077RYY6_WHEAT|nr:unnamed protein product [Triticum aestivum]
MWRPGGSQIQSPGLPFSPSSSLAAARGRGRAKPCRRRRQRGLGALPLVRGWCGPAPPGRSVVFGRTSRRGVAALRRFHTSTEGGFKLWGVAVIRDGSGATGSVAARPDQGPGVGLVSGSRSARWRDLDPSHGDRILVVSRAFSSGSLMATRGSLNENPPMWVSDDLEITEVVFGGPIIGNGDRFIGMNLHTDDSDDVDERNVVFLRREKLLKSLKKFGILKYVFYASSIYDPPK